MVDSELIDFTDSTYSRSLLEKTGEERSKLPDVILFGCSKCGTRAFIDFLDHHPHVESAGKEVDYFNRNYDMGLKWYESKMPKAHEGDVIIEKSPDYLDNLAVPERIYEMNSSIKLIVILCEPIRRALSDYAQEVASNKTQKRFEEKAFLPNGDVNAEYYAIKRGKYSLYLNFWIRQFPLDNIHIVEGNLLRDKPWIVMEDAEEYLGLPKYFREEMFHLDEKVKLYTYVRDGEPMPVGEAKGRKHPTLTKEQLEALQTYYEPYNEDLFNLIDQRFNWIYKQEN